MKHIQKQKIPLAFKMWKAAYRAKNGNTLQDLYEQSDMTGKKLWSALGTSKNEARIYSKAELKQALLEEQKHICCYCNQELTFEKTTIEHFMPKGNPLYFKLAYDYDNLLASCDGFAMEPKPRDICCNVRRAEHELLPLNPVDETIEQHFDFTVDGQIIGLTPNGKEMIRQLGLDIVKLDDLRAAYINDYLYENPFSEIPVYISQEEALFRIEGLKQPIDGRFEPFCMAIIKVLEREVLNV